MIGIIITTLRSAIVKRFIPKIIPKIIASLGVFMFITALSPFLVALFEKLSGQEISHYYNSFLIKMIAVMLFYPITLAMIYTINLSLQLAVDIHISDESSLNITAGILTAVMGSIFLTRREDEKN